MSTTGVTGDSELIEKHDATWEALNAQAYLEIHK
jgi:hypothetical protein